MYLRTGCPPIFQYPANRLHYIAAKYPEIRNKVAHVLDSKSFLMHILTGEYFTDYSTANSMGCLDISGNWDEEIIASTGFSTAQFPKVLNGFADKVELKSSICSSLGLKAAPPFLPGFMMDCTGRSLDPDSSPILLSGILAPRGCSEYRRLCRFMIWRVA